MTYIETGDLTNEQLVIAIERHVAEAQMHLITAQTLFEVASERFGGFHARPRIDQSELWNSELRGFESPRGRFSSICGHQAP
jgi:hypothetical protein